MARGIAAQNLVKQLQTVKKKIAEVVDRRSKLKSGKQVLVIGDNAMLIAFNNDPNDNILNRIHRQVPESASMNKSVIGAIVISTMKRYFERTYPAYSEKLHESRAYVLRILKGRSLFVVFNSVRNMQDGMDRCRISLKSNPSLHSRITSAFLSTATGKKDAMHFSHLRGPGVQRNEAARDLLDEAINIGIKGGASLYKLRQLGSAKRTINDVITLDAEVKLDRFVSDKVMGIIGNVELHVGIVETAEANQVSGGRSGREIQKAVPAIDSVIDDIIRKLDLVTMKTSKSLIEMYDDTIRDVFMDRKPTARHNKKTIKANTKFKIKSTENETRHYVQPPVGKSRKAGKSKTSYLDIQRQINASIHDTLKYDVMGKGTATEKLNYRTGRFAESAKISKIIPPVGNLRQHTINVRYMYNPYMVFAAGGRLHKPLRDPERLIGQAIRKIIKDQAINELSSHKTRAY